MYDNFNVDTFLNEYGQPAPVSADLLRRINADATRIQSRFMARKRLMQTVMRAPRSIKEFMAATFRGPALTGSLTACMALAVIVGASDTEAKFSYPGAEVALLDEISAVETDPQDVNDIIEFLLE